MLISSAEHWGMLQVCCVSQTHSSRSETKRCPSSMFRKHWNASTWYISPWYRETASAQPQLCSSVCSSWRRVGQLLSRSAQYHSEPACSRISSTPHSLGGS